MLLECLMNVCQKKIIHGDLKVEKNSYGGQKNRYKDTLKALKTSNYQHSRGNRLHRIEQSGEAS